MHLLDEGTNQLLAEWTRGSKVLGVQMVLLLAGDLWLDGYNIQGERVIIIIIVQLSKYSESMIKLFYHRLSPDV